MGWAPNAGPKSGWSLVVEELIPAIHAALLAFTGRAEMSAFQTLSAGKTGHDGAAVTGVEAAAGATPLGTSGSPSPVRAMTNQRDRQRRILVCRQRRATRLRE